MHRQGFTIVELAVVIAVLGILAAITMGAYGQWRAATAKKEVQSDLIAASAAMENARNFGSGYPLSIPSTFTGSSGVNLTYKAGGTAQAYCLDASSIKVPSVTYYLSSANGNRTPAVGTCP
jgi:type IV pilus assembly protein PilE